MINKSALPPVIVPLDAKAHRWASNLATEQSTPENGKRVYLNALAVYAVHLFLEWLEIETDLSAGESGNPYLCGLLDTADLWLPQLGRRLECRPVLPKEIALTLPMETTTDLMGYVAVQFEERLDKVQLLGFAPALADENLPEAILIENLQPLESLCQSLEDLEIAAIIASKQPQQPDLAGQALVQLGQWLQGVFERDWQSPKLVLDSIGRRDAQDLPRTDSDQLKEPPGAKKIEIAGHSMALVVWVTPKSEQEEDIRLLITMIKSSTVLPEGLKLEVLDESGEAVLSNTAQQADNWIDINFGIEPREAFSVRVMLNNISHTENFLS